jgi:RimJ/RimL family protein N-acetyltransferase
MNRFEITELTRENYPGFAAHIRRHCRESGRNGYYFMPFIPGDTDQPRGVDVEKLDLPLTNPHWQRGFVAIERSTGLTIGHVDLKGERLKTLLHRCELGMGLEEKWRGQGLGEKLLQTAIDYARSIPQLDWIDLSTFATNTRAQALYRRAGFEQTCLIRDRFRINDVVVDDIGMALKLR